MGFFSKGLKNEFEIAVLNEPSVFEPLKFCCIYNHAYSAYTVMKGLVEYHADLQIRFGNNYEIIRICEVTPFHIP